ncbi:unnamed protein product [Callosobruchus maculatus]|uniref:NADP-dependent oxidoreductase domain-containing protein n=1 Tax=Callosobruchus maculatus TaxID=64391 RepID=A0A653DZC2_CALMS|nr:unnamed protein product [Callosobruchus maculatus]
MWGCPGGSENPEVYEGCSIPPSIHQNTDSCFTLISGHQCAIGRLTEIESIRFFMSIRHVKHVRAGDREVLPPAPNPESAPGEVKEAVKYAIDVGYRHIDCAWLYGNEKEIGEGIREKLNDGKVDKNLPFKDAVNIQYDFVETWKGMEECVQLGLTKSIGLSNFNSKQVQRILDAAKIKPVMNQIEVSPNLNQKKLIKFCKDRQVEITAYSPFGSPTRPWAKPGEPIVRLDDPKLIEIGNKYGKTSSQVILR